MASLYAALYNSILCPVLLFLPDQKVPRLVILGVLCRRVRFGIALALARRRQCRLQLLELSSGRSLLIAMPS